MTGLSREGGSATSDDPATHLRRSLAGDQEAEMARLNKSVRGAASGCEALSNIDHMFFR